MPIPLAVWALIAASAGSAASSAASSQSSSNTRKSQEELSREQLAQDERQDERGVAVSESAMDPFRQQQQQARALASLDLMARGKHSKPTVTAAPEYAKYVPKVSGGFSYEQDPALAPMYEALKQNVAAGRGAPTMTNPANYGKTAALNLLDPKLDPTQGTADLSTPPVPIPGPAPPKLLPGATAPNWNPAYMDWQRDLVLYGQWKEQNPRAAAAAEQARGGLPGTSTNTRVAPRTAQPRSAAPTPAAGLPTPAPTPAAPRPAGGAASTIYDDVFGAPVATDEATRRAKTRRSRLNPDLLLAGR